MTQLPRLIHTSLHCITGWLIRDQVFADSFESGETATATTHFLCLSSGYRPWVQLQVYYWEIRMFLEMMCKYPCRTGRSMAIELLYSRSLASVSPCGERLAVELCSVPLQTKQALLKCQIFSPVFSPRKWNRFSNLSISIQKYFFTIHMIMYTQS